MKDSRQPRSGPDRKSHLSADAERLVSAALGLANSGSRVEDRFWDAQLSNRLDQLLRDGHAQPVYDALERLHLTDLEAYGALIEATEENSESVFIEHDGQPWQILLVSTPFVAWTRFRIPAGAINPTATRQIEQYWQEHLLVPDVRIGLVPTLFSIDQLPRDFVSLRKMVHGLGERLLAGEKEPANASLPDTAEMLADARFIVGAVAAPVGSPIFRWQSTDPKIQRSRVQALERWVEHLRPTISEILPGCGFECLLPDAYHINLRESDRRVRPYYIRAAAHYLTHTLSLKPDAIRATIGAFGYERCDEYRIGLTVDRDGESVVHGIVWPLLGGESPSDDPAPLTRICELLTDVGITDIAQWSGVVEPEFCEDCGAPLYPNRHDEVTHAELPDDLIPNTTHFH